MTANVTAGKVRAIKTDYLRIQGNCLELPETCIQLSNISLFSTSNMERPSLVLIAAAAVIFFIGVKMCDVSVLGGLFLTILGIAIGCYWLVALINARDSKRLTIVTNSGVAYSIVFGDQAFLNTVVSVITQIIRNPRPESTVIFDMKNSSFTSSAIGPNSRVTGR